MELNLNTMLDESITEEVLKKQQAFDALFNGYSKKTLDKWLSLSNERFYESLISKVSFIREFKNNDTWLNEQADHVEEYLGLKGDTLWSYLESEDGTEDKENFNSLISGAKLLLARFLGYIKFAGETVVIASSFIARVGFYFTGAIADAFIDTAKFAIADFNIAKEAVKESYSSNVKSPKSVVDVLKKRAKGV